MTGALVIVAAMVIVGSLLFLTDVAYFRHKDAMRKQAGEDESQAEESVSTEEVSDHGELCCGMHLVCEKTSLAINSDEIIYYDDEELDRFAGREPSSYTTEETEEFREILMTLLPQDIAGWARSIRLRKIELPEEVKDELLMLVTELRSATAV